MPEKLYRWRAQRKQSRLHAHLLTFFLIFFFTIPFFFWGLYFFCVNMYAYCMAIKIFKSFFFLLLAPIPTASLSFLYIITLFFLPIGCSINHGKRRKVQEDGGEGKKTCISDTWRVCPIYKMDFFHFFFRYSIFCIHPCVQVYNIKKKNFYCLS